MASNLGQFLGGVVNQRNNVAQQNFQARALDVQENQMRAAERQAQLQSVRDNISTIGENLRSVREQGGDVTQSLAAADAQIQETIGLLMQRDPATARSMTMEWQAMRNAIESIPTPQEAAAMEGRNTATSDIAQFEMLRERFGEDVARQAILGGSGSESFTFTDESGNTFSLNRSNGIGSAGATMSNEENLGRGTRTRVNDILINTSNALDRAIQTRNSFNEQYLNVPERFGFFVDAWRDRLNPDALDPARRQELADYTAFRQDAVSDLIETLRELSGAAVTQQEFQRLQSAMPNPGEGIMDGDSPVEFSRKMDERIQDLNRVMLRTQIWRMEGAIGVPMDMMTLSAVDGWLTERSRRMRQTMELEYPGFTELTPEQQNAAVQQRLEQMLSPTMQNAGVPYGQ